MLHQQVGSTHLEIFQLVPSVLSLVSLLPTDLSRGLCGRLGGTVPLGLLSELRGELVGSNFIG